MSTIFKTLLLSFLLAVFSLITLAGVPTVTCSSGGSSFAFVEEFDTQGSWTGDIGSSNGQWHFGEFGATPSSSTGPSAAESGIAYAYFEASGNSTSTASALSPAIDLSGATDEVELSFFIHAYGSAMGTFEIKVATDAAGPFTSLFLQEGQVQAAAADPWSFHEIDLSAYIGQVIYIQLNHTGAGGFQGDFAIDFLRIESCGSFCVSPSSLNTFNATTSGATITWVENGSAPQWDIELIESGTPPTGTPTFSGLNSTVFNWTNGEPSTSYEAYVRSNCGADGFSSWVGPLPFTTLTPPWLEWQEATEDRLVLSSVANSDGEEKDISAADLDQNGWDDIVVVRKEPFSVGADAAKSDLLLMNYDGVLTDVTALLAPEFISNPSFARDLIIKDFDGDGWDDVVIANTFDQLPMFYRNLGLDGNGEWLGLADESSTRFPATLDDTPLMCAVWSGDINGDSFEDIYFCNYRQNSGGGFAKDFLFINDGTGHFVDEAQARLGDLRNSAFGTAVQIEDIDNDGDQDILKVSTLFSVAPWNDNGLFVLFNDGTGNFSNWNNIAPFSPYMFEIGDWNADGQADLFVVDDGLDYQLRIDSVIPDTTIFWTRLNVSGGSSGFGGNVHSADLDLDGDLDIATADVDVDIPPCNSSREFALLRNDTGGFSNTYNGEEHPWELNTYDFALLDINNDGLIDVFKGACQGYEIYMSDNCQLVTSAADFDNDGLPDACDACPSNPDVNCTEPLEFPQISIADHNVARQWNDMLLESIRRDFARPTVHARNLFHSSIAMWDAWASFEDDACAYFLGKTVDGWTTEYNGMPAVNDVQAAKDQAISYASYRLLTHRFANSPGAVELLTAYDFHMSKLGYDIDFTSQDYSTGSPAALGNYIAQNIIDFGAQDGSNEQGGYGNTAYSPVNTALVVDNPGNPTIADLNRWQPLTLDIFIDQSGNEIPGETPEFLSPEWGQVSNFSLDDADLSVNQRDGFDYKVYHDPGMPPQFDPSGTTPSDDYKWGFSTVVKWSAHLDPTDGVMWDISPNSIGDRDLSAISGVADYPNFYNQNDGGTVSGGHSVNPVTGQPYSVNMVPRGDYARVLAEFWADGPDSETPPGHWFTLFNYVSDHQDLVKKFEGQGPDLSDMEWDVKGYFMMGGAMHDAAVTAWGIKGWYDYIRPVSAIRALAEIGQSSDPAGLSYDPAGIPLETGYIELVETGDPLAGAGDEHVGKIKVKSWKGSTFINNVDVDVAGVDWILAENWEPYQRPSFVTPPFAGYVSGHSTYSRAAAEIMTSITGDEFFPGGMGSFTAPANEFLVFEDGPSVDVELQWATYRDAADESGLSRIWGGIHPPADDIPGRMMGIQIGLDAFSKAKTYFTDQDSDGVADACFTCPADIVIDGVINVDDFLDLNSMYGQSCNGCREDLNNDGVVNVNDFLDLNSAFGTNCDN